MRRVKLCQLNKTKAVYCIYFDDAHSFNFTSKEKAETAFAALNNYFTKALFFINQNYSDIFQMYRNEYFAIENPFINNNIKRDFEHIESSLDLALNRSHWENGNYFTLKHIENMFSTMFGVLLHLREHGKEKKITTLVYNVDVKKDLIKIYYDNFMDLQRALTESRKFEIDKIIQKLAS